MQTETEAQPDGGRARPLSVEERQAMIIDAVAPLLAEYGRDVTSKQMAEAAGVAEGTIFRAFGDKENLIRAVVEKLLDPEPMRSEIRAIDPALGLEVKVLTIVEHLQKRFSEVFRIMAVIRAERPRTPEARGEFAQIVAGVLEPELAELNWPTERVAHIIRLITFSSTFPRLNEGVEFTAGELTDIILYGIAGHPGPQDKPAHKTNQTRTKSNKKEETCS